MSEGIHLHMWRHLFANHPIWRLKVRRRVSYFFYFSLQPSNYGLSQYYLKPIPRESKGWQRECLMHMFMFSSDIKCMLMDIELQIFWVYILTIHEHRHTMQLFALHTDRPKVCPLHVTTLLSDFTFLLLSTISVLSLSVEPHFQIFSTLRNSSITEI